MDGATINERVREHRCIVCGVYVDDYFLGQLDGSGFTYRECVLHRTCRPAPSPKFDADAEHAAGIAILDRLLAEPKD